MFKLGRIFDWLLKWWKIGSIIASGAAGVAMTAWAAMLQHTWPARIAIGCATAGGLTTLTLVGSKLRQHVVQSWFKRLRFDPPIISQVALDTTQVRLRIENRSHSQVTDACAMIDRIDLLNEYSPRTRDFTSQFIALPLSTEHPRPSTNYADPREWTGFSVLLLSYNCGDHHVSVHSPNAPDGVFRFPACRAVISVVANGANSTTIRERYLMDVNEQWQLVFVVAPPNPEPINPTGDYPKPLPPPDREKQRLAAEQRALVKRMFTQP